jgi:hypothetical protein
MSMPPANCRWGPNKAQSFNRCWSSTKATEIYTSPFIRSNTCQSTHWYNWTSCFFCTRYTISHYTPRADYWWGRRRHSIGILCRSFAWSFSSRSLKPGSRNCPKAGKPINYLVYNIPRHHK